MSSTDSSELKIRLHALYIERDRMLASGESFREPDGVLKEKEITERILAIERKVASSESKPYAEPMEWCFPWTTSSKFSVRFTEKFSAFFAYDFLREDVERNQNVAVVKLISAYSLKCGGANDELIRGHQLFGRGIQASGAYLVNNSPWIAEERRASEHHHLFEPRVWDQYRHMIWLFHDGQVEAIAVDAQVSVRRGSLASFAESVD